MFLSSKFGFDWKQIVKNSKEKDDWVDEIEISKIIEGFDVSRFSNIKWVSIPDYRDCSEKLKIIAKDILLGNKNSLVEK